MSDSSTKLGKCLAQMRRKAQLSLRAVEAETGISNAYLSQLETGKIKTPSPNVLHTLALRYGASYAQLMRLAGYPASQEPPGDAEATTDSFSARIGDVTPDEEDALIEFLSLIRKRERNAQ